jgi:hypothetical protein
VKKTDGRCSARARSSRNGRWLKCLCVKFGSLPLVGRVWCVNGNLTSSLFFHTYYARRCFSRHRALVLNRRQISTQLLEPILMLCHQFDRLSTDMRPSIYRQRHVSMLNRRAGLLFY